MGSYYRKAQPSKHRGAAACFKHSGVSASVPATAASNINGAPNAINNHVRVKSRRSDRTAEAKFIIEGGSMTSS